MPDQTLKKQQAINGAICCQDEPAAEDAEWLFSAADVPTEPFLEGAAFFQFACFGYGTPAESDFAHWDPKMGRAFNAKSDFIGALPKKLLAHRQGPIVYIGHLDVALLNGFDDPANPGGADDPWHTRAACSFYKAVKDLLGVRPAGLAVRAMNERYNTYNSQLTTLFDMLQRRKLVADERFQQRLVDSFLIRSDAAELYDSWRPRRPPSNSKIGQGARMADEPTESTTQPSSDPPAKPKRAAPRKTTKPKSKSPRKTKNAEATFVTGVVRTTRTVSPCPALVLFQPGTESEVSSYA